MVLEMSRSFESSKGRRRREHARVKVACHPPHPRAATEPRLRLPLDRHHPGVQGLLLEVPHRQPRCGVPGLLQGVRAPRLPIVHRSEAWLQMRRGSGHAPLPEGAGADQDKLF